MDEHLREIEKKLDALLATFDAQSYKINDVLYFFPDEIFQDSILLLRECKLPKTYSSYKDFLRDKFFAKLGFEENDLILFIDGGVYGKVYFQIELPADCAERRGCGLPLELLKEHKQTFFANDSYKEDVLALLRYVIDDNLSFRKINPIEFKKIYLSVLVNIFEIVVMEDTSLKDLRSIKGLSYYLLRDMFDELMLFIAGNILFHFSNQDKKAFEFLSYFSVYGSVGVDGERYKANPILDESSYAWNMTTIRSTMIQHKRAKQAIYDKKNALISIGKKLELYKINEQELKKQIKEGNKLIHGAEAKIANIHKILDKLQDTDANEVVFVEDGQEKSYQRKELLAKIYKKEDEAISEKTKLLKSLKDAEMALENKKKEIYVWEKKYAENKGLLAVAEKSGHPIDKQYERIQRALAKTLTAR
ncbi:MAG: hypothetical protein PHN38_08425 [Sulfurospirillaceae bacterium]|nr:hypothetical protein [Sulfurospirillaceae bacterium]MDD3462774.1 hypothetical protein [Sulfurospirillaceae bacterium]